MGIVQWLLKRFDHRKTEHAAERRIRNTAGETEVAQFVVPIVKYDVNTGEFKNFDEWDDDMTFNGDLTINGNITYTGYQYYYKDMELTGDFRLLTVGDAIQFGDLDTEILEAIDDELIIKTGANERLKIKNSGIEVAGDVEVGDDIFMGIGQIVYLDDDNDSYIVCSADDVLEFYSGGTSRMKIDANGYVRIKDGNRFYLSDTNTDYMRMSGGGLLWFVNNTKIMEGYSSGIYYFANLVTRNPGYLIMQELAAGVPGGSAGYGKLCCVDNAGTTELWFVDDTGTSTKLA